MSISHDGRGWRHVSVLLSALSIVIGVVAAVVGLTLWIAIAAAAAPWVVALSRTYGARVSVPVTATFGALGLLLVLTAATALPFALMATLMGAIGLFGFGGVVTLVRTPTADARTSHGSRAAWLAPLVGVAAWAATMISSLFIPGAARSSWVMMGDSANNMLFAREIIYANGVAVGPGENPVPLPAGMIATSVLAGRESSATADLVQHDIAGFALVWALVIGALCYVIGAVAVALMPRDRPALVAVVGAAASLLPFSWFIGGYPLEFGFFNTHISLVLVLLCWLLALSAERAPWLVLATYFAASTLQLAVWSPFVLVPVALGIVVAVHNRASLIRTRGGPLVILAVAFLQLVAYALLVTLPSLLALSSFLSAQGGIFPFSRKMIIAVFIGGFVVALASILVRRSRVGWQLVATLVGLGAGQLGLLYLSRNESTLWTYYPTKFAWMASIIGMVIVIGIVIGVAAQLVRSRIAVAAIVFATTVATIGVLVWAPTAVPSYSWMNPADRVLRGEFVIGGEQTVERIFELSDPDRPSVLWNSGDPAESTINFWLLQLRADTAKGNNDLRVFAYGYYDLTSADDLCEIVALMGGTVTVHTEDRTLEDELAMRCSDLDAVVIAEPFVGPSK